MVAFGGAALPQHPRSALETEQGSLLVRRVGLLGGGAAFLLMRAVPGPASLGPEGWAAAAVMVLMASWWMTEAVPIPVTALLPLVLFPALGLMNMQEAAGPYANELIFLFMGGFFLSRAMERWGLHRRVCAQLQRWPDLYS